MSTSGDVLIEKTGRRKKKFSKQNVGEKRGRYGSGVSPYLPPQYSRQSGGIFIGQDGQKQGKLPNFGNHSLTTKNV